MTLFPYQKAGVAWLTKKGRAYLADEMGLGKTVQALMAGAALGVPLSHTLVVCPASAVENWRHECLMWCGEEAKIQSYDNLRLHGPIIHPELLIVDEAHYVKNPKAKRTQAVMEVGRRTRYCFMLSGTPMPNDAGELFVPLQLLRPDIIPWEYWGFFRHFNKTYQTPYGPRAYALRNREELGELIRQVMLRRSLGQVALDLPPLRIDLHRLPRADKIAREDIEEAVENYRAEENRADTNGSRLRRLLGGIKGPMIASLISEELAADEYQQVVVMAYHHDTLNLFRERLAKFGVAGFDGSTPQAHREAEIERFNQNPENRVFVAQQGAAGVAINLQAAHEIVLAEPDWNADANRQAIKRLHRIGQTEPVRARVFAVSGSLDEGIMEAIVKKARMATVLESARGGATL